MLFTSSVFLIYFLPLTAIGYQAIARFGRRAVIGWLVVASLFFYAYWNPRFLMVLLASLLGNFLLSRLISQSVLERSKKRWMVLGIALNLLALGYFKYLFPSLRFLSGFGWMHLSWPDILLPLGISFFTFTQIAYLVDLSEGEAKPQTLLEYALFVTFFPHLIAGPILHHKEMMPQFSEERKYTLKAEDVLLGLTWFVLGLAKKTLLADRLAPTAEVLFRHVSTLTPREAWIAALTYSLQLYFDFSGYSDMAIGLARIFSIRFPFNFNSPYKAASIIDFWARWHMTLTRYLTLYLYNPLSMAVNRKRLIWGQPISKKAQRTASGFASMIGWPTIATMFLAGIWHGAGFQFLVFGLLHGTFITTNHAWRNLHGRREHAAAPSLWGHVGSVMLTYLCVLVGQVFFRANSASDAARLLCAMVGFTQVHESHLVNSPGLLCLLLFPVVWFMPNTQEMLQATTEGIERSSVWKHLRYSSSWLWTLSMSVLLVAALLFSSDYATFLYFQF